MTDMKYCPKCGNILKDMGGGRAHAIAVIPR